jgi:hypothetical protein
MIGLEKGIVQVIPLRSSWRANYGQERRLIQEHIGGHVLDIRHAGSTAVPELDGKPIIDIAVAVASTLEIARCRPPLRLNDLGYIDRGDSGRDGGYLFVTEPHPRCGPVIRTWMRSHSCDSRSYLPDRGPRSHDGELGVAATARTCALLVSMPGASGRQRPAGLRGNYGGCSRHPGLRRNAP